MLYAIVFAIIVAGVAGLPVVPVFIVGAFAMLATAYMLSRSERLLSICAVYFLSVMLHFSSAEFPFPAWMSFTSSDTFLYVCSGAVMVLAGAIGIFSPLDPKMLEQDGALQMVKEREAEQITSSLMARLLGKK